VRLPFGGIPLADPVGLGGDFQLGQRPRYLLPCMGRRTYPLSSGACPSRMARIRSPPSPTPGKGRLCPAESSELPGPHRRTATWLAVPHGPPLLLLLPGRAAAARSAHRYRTPGPNRGSWSGSRRRGGHSCRTYRSSRCRKKARGDTATWACLLVGVSAGSRNSLWYRSTPPVGLVPGHQ